MKKLLVIFTIFTGLSAPHTFAQTTKNIASYKSTYANPLPVKFGDPYVLHTKGKYYMYGTGGGVR
ncbi:MAG: hypothetical protein WKG06_20255 [Segetibacter sp.]